jgi:hypothetical protein
MVETIFADASPEKRLFISLLSRDISLIDAILDILDNSVNSALEPYADRLKTAEDYEKLLDDVLVKPKCKIKVNFDDKTLTISDNAGGISQKQAENSVFKFGRPAHNEAKGDRLSVYGIGLKRAIFKIGDQIDITSNHKEGGFELDLKVSDWAKLDQVSWKFPIAALEPSKTTGTVIKVSEFHSDIGKRFKDGLLEGQLKEQISKIYALFIGRIVEIEVNGVNVIGLSFIVGSNMTSQQFNVGVVSCTAKAGVAEQTDGRFRDSGSGWFVFCNGRNVIFGDKTRLTGWSNNGLPIFQPKHRPFLGLVFFFSENPELLPWTTTKADINEESDVWQEALKVMLVVARPALRYIDGRYTEDGTTASPDEVSKASGEKVSILKAAASTQRTVFQVPKTPKPRTIKVQYEVQFNDVKKVEEYIKRPGLGGSGVGRYTFDHFLKNEIGEDE